MALWINELHYSNDFDDSNQGVEIAGPANFALDRFELLRVSFDGNTTPDTNGRVIGMNLCTFSKGCGSM